MTDIIYLSSSDGFTFSAAKAEPAGEVKGGVIILQEIFGLNTHICEVVEICSTRLAGYRTCLI